MLVFSTRDATPDAAAETLALSSEGTPQGPAAYASLPQHLADKLPELYQSSFSTLEYFQTFRDTRSPSAIAFGEPAPRQILCYTVAGDTLVVLNEYVKLDRRAVEEFAHAAFVQHKGVHRIRFTKLQCPIEELALPNRALPDGVDYVIELPPTFAEYRAQLGTETRKNLNRRLNKLVREQPGVRFEVLRGDDIDVELIRRIVHFNHRRMQVKGRVSRLDDHFTQSLFRVARRSGYVPIIRLDGEVIAGQVMSRAGNHCYSHILAHDPLRDNLQPGALCLQHAIETSIGEGGVAFHLLWGDFDYKRHFLGVRQEQLQLMVYRSIAHKWRDWQSLATLAQLRIKERLVEYQRQRKAKPVRQSAR